MTPDEKHHSRFEKRIDLPCYFFDFRRIMRPAAFFDIAQQIGMEGAAALDASDQTLNKRGLAWILIRMHVHYERLPQLFETVRMQTWHSGIAGPLFTRDYLMLDEAGKAIICATGSWALMDMGTRGLAKNDRIEDLISAEPQCPDRVLEANAAKIVWPKALQPEITVPHTVAYSDVDYNGHANNARYPVWAYDALPSEFSTGRIISDFHINYNRELHPSETAILNLARPDDDTWLVEGSHDGVQNFICRIEFSR